MIRAAALAGMLAVSSNARAGTPERWDGGTVAAQAGGGLISGLVIGAGAGLAGGLLGSALGKKGDWGAPLIGAVFGFGLGAIFGSVWAIDYIGDDRGQDGSVGATLFGTLGGLGVDIGIEVALAKAKVRVPGPVHVALTVTTLLAGPIIGYQLSARDGGSAKRIPMIGFRF